MAEVTRAWMSLALMVSTLSFTPSAFSHSAAISLRSSWSEAGTKSFQRSQWSVDLSVRGSATGGENARHPTHPGRDCAAARKFYETTPIQACHGVLSLEFFVEGRLYGQPRHYSRARWGAGAHCSGRKAWLGGLKTKLRSSLVARAASAQRQAFYSARKGAVWYWSTVIPVPCAWRYHIFKTRFRVPV